MWGGAAAGAVARVVCCFAHRARGAGDAACDVVMEEINRVAEAFDLPLVLVRRECMGLTSVFACSRAVRWRRGQRLRRRRQRASCGTTVG